MTNQASLEDFAQFEKQADRSARQETGNALSASYKALLFNMNLREIQGQSVDWKAIPNGLKHA